MKLKMILVTFAVILAGVSIGYLGTQLFGKNPMFALGGGMLGYGIGEFTKKPKKKKSVTTTIQEV